MRVCLAGTTVVIGREVLPLLVDRDREREA